MLEPSAAIHAGRFHKVPVMVGWTRDEATWQVASIETANGKPVDANFFNLNVQGLAAAGGPDRAKKAKEDIEARYPLKSFPNAATALAHVWTDYGIVCPSLRMLDDVSRWAPAFGYEFADENAPQYNSPGSVAFGAAHTSELQYLFPGFHGATGPFTPLSPDQQRLANVMQAYWAGFAKDGKPSAKSAASWPAYRSGSRDMLVLKPPRPFSAPAGYTGDRQCAMWDKLSN